MLGGGVGFFGGGSGGGGSAEVVDIKQYTVGEGNGPVDQSTTFVPAGLGIQGTNLSAFVNSGGYLANASQSTPQFSFVTSGGYITSITLLTGLRFNAGELWTFTGWN